MSVEDDLFLLEAQREVDACTPAVPPLAPPLPALCGVVLGRHVCIEPADTNDAHHTYHRAKNGTLWLNTTVRVYKGGGQYALVPRPAQDTGPRPPGVHVHAATQEFELPDGRRVPVATVARDGWKVLLEWVAEHAV